MKKALLFLFNLYISDVVLAQTATVRGGPVTDSDTQVWYNGTWGYEFYPNPSYPNLSQYYINGVPLSNYYSGPVGGSLDSSGNFTTAGVPRNDMINPSGSQWRFKVCPNATGACGFFIAPVNTASVDFTANINANIKAPRFNAIAGSYGYNDAETQLNPLVAGSTYWNVSSACQKYYSNTTSTWSCPSFSGYAGVSSDGANGLTIVGAVNSSALRAKGSPWWDVTAYGADPTGGVDATSIINARLQACLATGGTVFVPAGTYLTSGLDMSSTSYSDHRCILQGAGQNATWLQDSTNGTIGVDTIGSSNIMIKDLTISSGPGATLQSGILLARSTVSPANGFNILQNVTVWG